MARRPKSPPAKPEGDASKPAPPTEPGVKKRPSRARTSQRSTKPAPSTPATQSVGAPPTPEQRLELLSQALGEIGKLCNFLIAAAPSPAANRPPPVVASPVPPDPGPLLPASVPADVGRTMLLDEFLQQLDEETHELNVAERNQIIDTAMDLLQSVYVHLPLKRTMYAVDPIQRLKLLRSRDDRSARAFHDEMLAIFHSLHDLHTTYILPSYYQQRTAFLPFLVEEYFEDPGDGPPSVGRYVVTKTCGVSHPADFVPGVEVTHWSGMPIARAVELNAVREAGSNVDAQHARGLEALTIRPMDLTAPPDERWVIVGYRTEDGRSLEHRFDWLVFSPPPPPSGLDPTTIGRQVGSVDLCLGVDARTESIRRSKKLLFEPRAMAVEHDPARVANAPPTPSDRGATIASPTTESGVDYQTESVRQSKRSLFDPEEMRTERVRDQDPTATNPAGGGADHRCVSTMPDVFQFRRVPDPQGKYGYVRIYTFMVADTDSFVDEFLRILALLPKDGLILDVRGNGGGNIMAGEKLLQTLTPRPIEPGRFHFLNSAATLDLCESSPFGIDLDRWAPSIRLAIETGETYSQGFPLESEDDYNQIGQRYQGPVVLIVDALCYSTTDIFAAGFQDHEIGPILGTARHTGAGGANVWDYSLFELSSNGRFRALPKGATFRVALRRTTRVGKNAGVPIEDLGVEPDRLHRMTRRDVLSHNEDLIAQALAILEGLPAYHLSARLDPSESSEIVVRVDARNVSRVDFYLADRPLGSADVRDGTAEFKRLDGLPSGATLVMRGIADGEVVAVARLPLP